MRIPYLVVEAVSVAVLQDFLHQHQILPFAVFPTCLRKVANLLKTCPFMEFNRPEI
jgi:hypothetical protein